MLIIDPYRFGHSFTVSPGAGTITLTGRTPTIAVVAPTFRAPPAGSVTITGATQTITIPGSPWNSADVSSAGVLAFSSGDSVATYTGAAGSARTVRGTQAHSSGAWYFEIVVLVAQSSSFGINVGVCKSTATLLDNFESMGANDLLFATGQAIITNANQTVFGTGIAFDSNAFRLGIAFNIGTDFKITSNGSTFTTPIAFTQAGNWMPCLNLGRHYTGSNNGNAGSIQLVTGASSLGFSVPGGYTAWG